MHGTIKSVKSDKSYGFIQLQGTRGGKQLFFHRNDLVDLPFDKSLLELDVEFEVEETGKGLRAECVRVRKN